MIDDVMCHFVKKKTNGGETKQWYFVIMHIWTLGRCKYDPTELINHQIN